MTYDMFLKIEGIDGESQDDRHAGEIDLLSFQWGMKQAGSMHRGGGGGTGRVEVEEIVFTHLVDMASANLMLYCANGKHIPEAYLVVRKAGETPLEYFKVTMKNCNVTSVVTGGDSGQEPLLEDFTLNFAAVKVEYSVQNADGTSSPGSVFGWDIRNNTAA